MKRGEAEAVREVVQGHRAATFDALLKDIVAGAAAGHPVGAVPEQRLVALVRIQMIDELGGLGLFDETAVAAERAGREMALGRLVPARGVTALAG